MEKKFAENIKVDLFQSLKVVQEVVCSIREKINPLETQIQRLGKGNQSMIELMYGMLTSQGQLLKYIYNHAKSPNEIRDVKQTQKLVELTCMELKELNQHIK